MLPLMQQIFKVVTARRSELLGVVASPPQPPQAENLDKIKLETRTEPDQCQWRTHIMQIHLLVVVVPVLSPVSFNQRQACGTRQLSSLLLLLLLPMSDIPMGCFNGMLQW